MGIQRDVPAMEHSITGTGEPLVLVPGSLTGWLSWIPHAEALAATFQVSRVQLHNVALGLAGDPLPPDYSANYEITALGNTLDKLAIEQAHFAGWSYGGELALSYAIHNPHRIRSLCLIEPAAYWVLRSRGPLSQPLLEEERFLNAMSNGDVSEDDLAAFIHNTGLAPAAIDPRTLPQWPVWVKHRQSLRMGGFAFGHKDSVDLLRAFDKPVLLVKGEGSSPSLHEITDILAEELPKAQAISFPGGHAPHIISMQPFLERYRRFLSENNPAR